MGVGGEWGGGACFDLEQFLFYPRFECALVGAVPGDGVPAAIFVGADVDFGAGGGDFFEGHSGGEEPFYVAFVWVLCHDVVPFAVVFFACTFIITHCVLLRKAYY